MSVNMETIEIYTDPVYLETIAEARKKFITLISKLCIPITCSLLQQYLINYIGNIEGALSNLEKMKQMYNILPKDDPSGQIYS